MLKRVHIRNFKNLKDVDIELRPLNVLIGANGSGKSNFIEAIGFIHECMYRPISEVAYRRGGAEQFLPVDIPDAPSGSGKGFSFNLQYEMSSGLHIEYIVSFIAIGFLILKSDLDVFRVRHNNTDYSLERGGLDADLVAVLKENAIIVKEMRRDAIDESRLLADFDKLQDTDRETIEATARLELFPALSNTFAGLLPEQKFQPVVQALREVKRFARNVEKLKLILDPKVPSIRESAVVKDWGRDLPRPEDVVSYLNWLNESKGGNEESEEAWFRIGNFLNAAIPGFVDLSFSRIYANKIGGEIKYLGQEGRIPFSQISDGSLLFIAAIALLVSRRKSPFLSIEEPEIGLHPTAQAIMAEALQFFSKPDRDREPVQIVTTTHSPGFLRNFDAEDVITVDIPRGLASGPPKFQRLSDKERVAKWLEDYDLGRAWEMGVLGAKQ